jgi:hypothetical protein
LTIRGSLPKEETLFVAIVHRLTVDGRDYFLPEPVSELKGKILEAIKAGGGYVNIPPLRSGPGIDILFSPGMPVVWTQIDVGAGAEGIDAASTLSESASATPAQGYDEL